MGVVVCFQENAIALVVTVWTYGILSVVVAGGGEGPKGWGGGPLAFRSNFGECANLQRYVEIQIPKPIFRNLLLVVFQQPHNYPPKKTAISCTSSSI